MSYSLLWAELCPSQKICSSPSPGTCECSLIWRQRLCRYNQAKMSSYRIRMSPKFNDWCPYQERFEDTEETQERSHVQTEAESGVRLSQAKGCKDCWPPAEARRVKEGFFPRASAGSTALPTSWFWTFGSQNCERISLVLSCPISSNLLQQPWEPNMLIKPCCLLTVFGLCVSGGLGMPHFHVLGQHECVWKACSFCTECEFIYSGFGKKWKQTLENN